MASMTKHERVLRTIDLQKTDRVPVYDILQNDGLIGHLAGQVLTVENGDRIKGIATRRCLDMTRMPGGPSRPGTYTREDGLVIQQERWTSWIVGRPWHDRPSLIQWIEAEIERAEAQRFDTEFGKAFHGRMERFQGYFGDDTVQVVESGVGLTQIYWALGWEEFSYLLADDPELIIAWLDARHRAELRRVDAIADPVRIPVALTYDDLAFKTGLLLSPRWLREHWVPRLRTLNEAWHNRGARCLFHSDGNLWPILDALVEAGIDGLNPIEVAAGMTVRSVREQYPQLFIAGGVDVSELLPLGSPDEVRAACLENVRATQGLGYFMGSTTELMWEIPLENMLTMFETARGTMPGEAPPRD